jgi:regulatory protein
MRVTRIEPVRRKPDRLIVWLDDRPALACHATVWADAGFGVDDDLSPADVQRLNDAENVHALVERALRLLAGRPRSRADLVQRLSRGTKAHPTPSRVAVDAAIERLAELGMVDDGAFAAFWVEQRDRFQPRGAQALRAELRRQGVAREEIAASVDPALDLARALDAGRSRAQRLSREAAGDARVFRDRLGAFLMRRGFTYAVARQAVAQLWQEVDAAE